MKPSRRAAVEAGRREMKQGVRSIKPRLTVPDLIRALDVEHKRTNQLERDLSELRIRLEYFMRYAK